MFCSTARRVAVGCSRVAARSLSIRPAIDLPRLAAVPVFKVQTRLSSVEVFGPFDTPKQLTFKEVEQRVLKAIRAWDRFPADKAGLLKLDAVFTELGFDSLDHVEIMMAIEDEFAFEVPLSEAERLKTPKDIFRFICEREDVFE